MKKYTLKISLFFFMSILFFGMTGCSGGSGGGSGDSATSNAGGGSKGPFKENSLVVAYKLVNGVRDINITTTTSDNRGSFDFGTSIGWIGATEFVISGEYLNENSGSYMILSSNNGLSAVTNIVSGTNEKVNINILTNIATPAIKASLALGTSITDAKADAQADVVEMFNLDLAAGAELTDLDLTEGSGSNAAANTQLLLISSALLNTDNPEETMQNLADGLESGEVDASATMALEEIQTEAANIDLQVLATNMQDANIGVTNAPSSESVLNGTLSFDNNISFAPEQDAFINTEYISNEATVIGMIGESGPISVTNGSYSIDGGTFVTATGTIANGQKVKVKVNSSPDYATTVQVTLTIGGANISYSVVTKSDPFVADTTPNAFDFGFKAGQALNTSNVTSNPVTITGINTPTAISIDDGSFTVNGDVNGSVKNGDVVIIQNNASPTAGTEVKSTLTIGGIEGTFSIFTVTEDTTPNTFTFDDINDVNKTATPTIDSNSITIAGINTDAPISVVGGEMNVAGAGFTAAATTISNGDTLVLRAIASDDYETTTTVTVTVGNVVSTFNITTMSDPFVADTTPNTFSFTTLLNQAVSTNIDASITVSGINTDTPISVTNGTYSVNGGGQDDNVSNGDVVVVTNTTSADFDTENVTTLIIGGVSATFKTRTLLEDTTPNDFSFDSNETVLVPTTEVISNTVTISGINTNLDISILNGEYSLDDGTTWTSVAGTIANGASITLKQVPATTQGTSKVTSLTVGSTIRSFTTKTQINAPAISGVPDSTVLEDSEYSFTPAIDINSGEIETWSIVNKPSWATFNTINGLLSGIPQNDDVGTINDINITATNAQGSSSIAIASLEVENTNDAPVAQGDNIITNEDISSILDVSTLVSDIDIGDNIATYAVSTAPAHGIASFTDGNVTYTPAANFFGTDNFAYTVTDVGGLSATATISVVVSSVNDIPIATDDNASTDEETAVTIEVTLNDTDIDGDTLSIFFVSESDNASVTFSGTTITYTPDNNFVGQEVVRYDITDGNGGNATANVTITVNNVNDAPERGEFTAITTIAEDAAYSFTATAFDVDGDTITFSLANNPSWMSINPSSGAISGTPQNADVGVTTGVQVLVTDGIIEAPVSIETFDIEVINTNDAPIADDAHIDVVTNNSYSATLVATDVDIGDSLVFSINNQADLNGSVNIDNNLTGAFTYTPTTNFEGNSSFEFIATDTNGTSSNIATITITVANRVVNIVTANDSAEIAEDTNISINVLGNDVSTFDDDGSIATGTIISTVSTPANGSATINSGVIEYVPDANYYGTDTFSYTAQTLSGNEANATVTVTITPVNDETVWNIANTLPAETENFGTLTVDLNATDIDGSLSFIATTTNNIVDVSVSGSTLTITSKTDLTGSETIIVTANDGIDNAIFNISLSVYSTATNVWHEGKTLHFIWMSSYDMEIDIEYEDIELAASNLIEASEYEYDANSTTWVSIISTDEDMRLDTTTGDWVTYPETYEINATDNSIMTIYDFLNLRLDSAVDIGGQTIDFTSEDGSFAIPVTFSTGALQYNTSNKLLDDIYRLDWEATVFDQNTSLYIELTSLESYMHIDGHFYHDHNTNADIYAEKNVDMNVSIYADGTEIVTLVLNDTGNLVDVNHSTNPPTQSIVGTWTVIELPGQENSGILTVQAVLDANVTNYDAYMEYGAAFATLYDANNNGTATVHMVKLIEAATDFSTDGDGGFLGNLQALDDIKAAIEAYDFSVFNVAAYFENGTRYFMNEYGSIGFRTFTYTDKTYTGSVNGVSESGTYSVIDNVMTLTRDLDSAVLEFTYANINEFGDGETFSLSINGDIAFETYFYNSEADRFDGMVLATASMKAFFENSTKYYLNANGETGFRSFSTVQDNNTLPYTGTYTGNAAGVDVNGTYEIFSNTMTLSNNNDDTLLFRHLSTAADELSQVFYLSINGVASSITTNYVNENDRDDAIIYWSPELDPITETDFINTVLTVVDPAGTWWYIEDVLNMESITIINGATISDGTISFVETIDGAEGILETIYFTNDNNVSLGGDFIGVQETDGGLYRDAVKFFNEMDQTALTTAYSNITWSSGAVAVENVGMTLKESFNKLSDAGTFATVSYADFTSLITGMTYGNSSADDDAYITGNGIDSLVFPTGSDTSGGDVVLSSDGSTIAGTFEIRDVDDGTGTLITTLVVTITNPSFDNEHIAFQYDETDMYRGNIYDRWHDLLLNDIAKEDVVNFLSL